MKATSVGSLTAIFVIAAVGYAQQPNTPRAGFVYPAGGQRGSTVRVVVGGQFLDNVSRAFVSGNGLQAAVVAHDKPLTPRVMNELREKLQALQPRRAEPQVQKEIVEIRQRITESTRRLANPVISEEVTIEITIAADAELGARQLRLGTPLGLSGPLVFQVGELPEITEEQLQSRPPGSSLGIELPAVVNGRLIPGEDERVQASLRPAQQYLPGDVDRYRFQARRGQVLVVAASARALMPYLADAVPGWLQATIALFDAAGRELAYNDDYRFEPDPVLHYLIAADGDYTVEIKDALHRGRADFVYRLSLGELPFITSVFPLGGRAGTRTAVAVEGWNLPAKTLLVEPRTRAPGIIPVAMQGGPWRSNVAAFAVDVLSEQTEREPNNSPADAQSVAAPMIVNGRIQERGDWDVYKFSAKAGDEIVADVLARRLGSPVDTVLEILDAGGRRMAFNDDHHDNASGLATHHADSLIAVKLPANGTYLLRIGDAQGKGGREYGYRVRLDRPRPDFELRVMPSTINTSVGGTVPIAVEVQRKGGFSGAIELALKDAPPGATLGGGFVPPGQDRVRLTLTAPAFPAREPFSVRLEGRATIQGRAVAHDALPADEMTQAFLYRHLVPADDLRLSVSGRGGVRAPSRILTPQPLKIPAGGAARLRVALPPLQMFKHLQLELSDPPPGVTIAKVSIEARTVEIVVSADATSIKPGARGNLIIAIFGERIAAAGITTPAARRRVSLGVLPAIAFQVIG